MQQPQREPKKAGWWARKSKGKKILWTLGGLVVLLIIIIIATTTGGEDGQVADAGAGSTTTAAVAATETPSTGATVGSTSTTEAATTSTAEAPTTTTEPAAETYSNGTYLVGTDLPAGIYKGQLDSMMGYWGITTDANGDDIVANSIPTGQFYVEVTEGQYLELTGVVIQDVKTAPMPTEPATADISDGVYLVGTDIAAGKYKGATSRDLAYWGITTDPNGQDIVQNDVPSGQFYVEVKVGQYLAISGATISLTK